VAITIKPLTKVEFDWIEQGLNTAQAFVAQFLGPDACEGISLTSLDRAFGEWLATDPSESAQIDSTIDAVSAAFGQLLVQHLTMNWVIVEDEGAAALAVHALPGQGDVLIYPKDLVAKRWQRREKDYLRPAFQQIAAHLKSLRK
jgi:hypothetical protein